MQEWKNVVLQGYGALDHEKYWKRFEERQISIQNNAAAILKMPIFIDVAKQVAMFTQSHNAILAKFDFLQFNGKVKRAVQ